MSSQNKMECVVYLSQEPSHLKNVNFIKTLENSLNNLAFLTRI